MSAWFTFNKIAENWWIWFAIVAVLCIICPLLAPVFGIASLVVGIYAYRRKANKSMIVSSILMGTILMSLTVFYIVSMCTMSYGISGVYTSF
jgi:accessory gene regulator protein AgrB